MGNISLLFFSLLFFGLVLLYLKKRSTDLDIIDIYIIFIALYFGIYPFIRGLYLGKGVVYDSFNSNYLAIALVFLQVYLIVFIIRAISVYFPEETNKYLKIKTLIEHWGRVDIFVVLSIYCILIIFQIVSYYKYGVKLHILPEDFAKIGKDLPYWLTSMRTIYNYLSLCVFIALAAKVAISAPRTRYFWIALILIFLPFISYSGRKALANIVVMGAIISLVRREENFIQVKYLKIAALMVFSFFLMSNIYQTYRSNLMTVGASLGKLGNPISAALNFNATLRNLKERPGTWEFNYLVFDKQLKEPGKMTTNGEITREGFKSAIPRVFWPGKKFQDTSDILAELYNSKFEVGTNIFGVAQAEFGYFSIIIVPLAILLIIIMIAGLMRVTINYPVFFWLLSVNILNFLICVEENQNELIFVVRNTIGIMAIYSLYLLINKIISGINIKRYST